MQTQRNRKKNARGFTLIELVIVIAVIAILAALLVPTILGQAERARISRAKSDAGEIAKALARIRTDTASTTAACYTTLTNLTSATPPTGAEACDVNTTCQQNEADPNLAGMPCWGGPYMNAAVTVDPWGTAWKVAYETTTRAITVTSNGPDKSSTTTTDDIVVTQ